MKKTLIVIISLATIALIAGTGFAWGPGHGRAMTGYTSGWNCPGYGYGAQAGLNDLSKDQRDQLFRLRQKFIDDTYEIRSARFRKIQEVRMLMETSNPDKTKLDKLSDEITSLQKQLMDKRFEFILAAKKIAPELGTGSGMGYGRGMMGRGMMGRGMMMGSGGMGGFHGQPGGCYYTD